MPVCGPVSVRSSSVRLVIILSAVIFCAEVFVMLALDYLKFSSHTATEAMIDATFLCAVIAPAVYIFLLRPYEQRLCAANTALSKALAESLASETALADTLARLRLQKTILDRHCLISQTDVRGYITYVNEEFCRVSGYSCDELIGSNHRIVKSGFHPIEFWQEMFETMVRDGVWQGQVCNSAKDGATYWVQATNVAERDAAGNIIGYVSVRSNITETKRREQELDNAYSELKVAIARAEAASRAKSGFLSTMSHEMRTPLNGVIGAMELLRLESLTERQKDLVNLATQSSEALLVHINDVLDFSKMEAGKLELIPKPFNLNQLIGSVVDIVMPQVRFGGNDIKTDVSPELANDLIGDQVRLRQILLNFVSNAAKFTSGGTITISVAAISSCTETSVVEFAVTDTGLGIPADRIGELFKEFSMLDSSYARRNGGTGLGLAISKSLAEMMGGQIGVESQEGQGSRFWFTAHLRHAAAESSSIVEAGNEISPSQGLRVLLVDDNSTNRLVGSQLLTAAGHVVKQVDSGRRAVEVAGEQPFDVILMDISMPEMDGLEATQLIRTVTTLNHETPIVALTAHAVAGDRERFLAAGMNGYLSKPIRLTDLEAQLAYFGKRTEKMRQAVELIGTSAVATNGTVNVDGSEDSVPMIMDPQELAALAELTSSEMVSTVIAQFITELTMRTVELSVAATQRKAVDVKAAAHAIAGAASSVGALRLAVLAKSIEIDCVDGCLEDGLKRAISLPAVAAVTEEVYRTYANNLGAVEAACA